MQRLSRRRFLELASAFSAAVAVHGCLPRRGGQPMPDNPSLPSTGGAPDTREGWMVAAFVDVVIPGKHRDPEGRPGALDVGAAGKFFEDGSQVKTLVPLLVSVLDGYSEDYARQDFLALRPSDREEVVAYALERFPDLDFALQLAKVAYYSAPETAAFFGYPGPNHGYLADDNFSFRRPMARPHPLTALNAGNLP